MERVVAKPISQREAAQRHIECAIRLLKTDDLKAHTLAYAAYGLLRELLGPGATLDAALKLEKKLKLGEIPNYFKHRYRGDPGAILQEHSPEEPYGRALLRYLQDRAGGRVQACAPGPQGPVRSCPPRPSCLLCVP